MECLELRTDLFTPVSALVFGSFLVFPLAMLFSLPLLLPLHLLLFLPLPLLFLFLFLLLLWYSLCYIVVPFAFALVFAFAITFFLVFCSFFLILLFYIMKEMEDDYKKSLKKGILDYVLLDVKEQRRLGLLMPEAVCKRSCYKHNIIYIYILVLFNCF